MPWSDDSDGKLSRGKIIAVASATTGPTLYLRNNSPVFDLFWHDPDFDVASGKAPPFLNGLVDAIRNGDIMLAEGRAQLKNFVDKMKFPIVHANVLRDAEICSCPLSAFRLLSSFGCKS